MLCWDFLRKQAKQGQIDSLNWQFYIHWCVDSVCCKLWHWSPQSSQTRIGLDFRFRLQPWNVPKSWKSVHCAKLTLLKYVHGGHKVPHYVPAVYIFHTGNSIYRSWLSKPDFLIKEHGKFSLYIPTGKVLFNLSRIRVTSMLIGAHTS